MSFLRRKKEKRISLFVPFLLIILGIFIGYKIFVSPKNNPKQWTIPDVSGSGIKYITEESLVKDIKNSNKLIPLELELSEIITIDDSWGSLGIFEKYKKISFTADCSYSIDLSDIQSSDLSLDPNSKKITIKIQKPTVYNVSINPEKTIYEEAITGLLRFGDLNISAEEYGIIEEAIIKNITLRMESSDLYQKACASSESSMKGLIKNILGDGIDVTVELL